MKANEKAMAAKQSAGLRRQQAPIAQRGLVRGHVIAVDMLRAEYRAPPVRHSPPTNHGLTPPDRHPETVVNVIKRSRRSHACRAV
jgi:hypothetical protein